MQGRISVLISDADRMYCNLLGKAFETCGKNFAVVASVCAISELLDAVKKHAPQTAVISANLQDGPSAGIKILPILRKIEPDLRILVSIGSHDRELIVEAFRAGADGVFSRSESFEVLCKSVEVVSQGQIWANTQELRYVLDAFAKAPKRPKLISGIEGRLTERESAVVRLAVEGLSNREIAEKLNLTEHTVKNYLFRVFEKLGVSNRVELVLSCLDDGSHAHDQLAAGKDSAPSKAVRR